VIGRALARKSLWGGSNLVDPNDAPWLLNPPSGGWLAGAGMSLEKAVGLPAMLGTLLRLAQGVGMLPQKVYEGPAPSRREALDAWQYELLHERPSSEMPPATFRGNLALQLAGAGRACVRKWKASSGRIAEFSVLDSTKVTPRRVNGQLVFEDRTADGKTPVVRTQRDIIYIPAVSLDGGPVGISPIAAARLALGTGLTRQRFEDSYYQRNAEPRVWLSTERDLTPDQAEEWADSWDSNHSGEAGWHRTSATGFGAKVNVIPVSLVDAQFVEANRFTAEQMASIYAMPKAFINLGDNSPTDADWRFFVTFGLGWITASIDQAFNADRDLFPQGSGLKAEHLTDALLKPDIRTRYEAYKAARQAGWMTSNEIRALENMPPHPDGDVLQVIPVGGGEPSQESAKQLLAELEILAAAAPAEDRKILKRAIARGRTQLGIA
jgi:HK97 family phage portal protein